MPNVRLLAVSASVVVFAVVVGHFWHDYQMRRNATNLLHRVDTALAAHELTLAKTVLTQYLRFRPDDAEQQIRLTELVDRAAVTRREKEESLRLHTLAIGLAPERTDLLRRRSQLSYELAYYSEAVRQADDVLRQRHDDAAALRVKALALAAQARLAGETPSERVAQVFEQAIKQSPGDVELALGLAGIYRAQMPSARDGDPAGRTQKAALADRVMKRLVDAAPRSPDAHLARYQYRQVHGLAGADADLQQAVTLDSDAKHFLVRLAAGFQKLEAGEHQEAAAMFDQAIAANPRDERGYLGLGRARLAADQPQAALAVWRRGLREADPNSLVLNFEIARANLAEGDVDEARVPLERLENELRRRAGRLPPRQREQWLEQVAVLRAEWHFAKGEYARAAELFERLAADAAERDGQQRTTDERASRLHARLGTARGQLGQWDRAITEYEQAVSLAPHSSERQLALAVAFQRAGRLEDAIEHYRRLLQLDEPPPVALTLAARALLEGQLAVTADRRHWDEFDSLIERARNLLADNPEVWLLEAERAFAAGSSDEASARLIRQVEASRDYDFCERSCAVFQRWGRLEEADRCLQRAERVGLPADRRVLASAALGVARRNLADAERLLRSSLAGETGPQRTELGLRLALVLLAAGETHRAKAELESLHRADPQNARVVQMLAELAWEDSDLEALEANERRLRESEGSEGTLWRFFRGLRLSAESPESDETRLAAAMQLQAEIERARPNWPAAYLLKGRLAERRQNADDAIAAYFTAVRLGEHRPQVYAYLATRLYQQGRYAEAHAVLEELKSRHPLAISLTGLELALDVRAGDLPSAVAAARRNAQRTPNDPAALVWLGQVLDVSDLHEEAEETLRAGTALAPSDVRPWAALLQHYLVAGKGDRARETFEEMQRLAVVSAKARPFLLAQCHELLGDREAAAAAYRQALEASPDVPAVWQRAARFYFACDRRQAEACLRRVIELRPNAALARRMLAALLVGAEGEPSLADAAGLLDTRGLGRADQLLNRRLNARLRLRHGTPDERREALRLLEEVVQQEKSPSVDDRLLLAHWYERDGRLRAARDQLLALVLVDRPMHDHLARLVEFLLRRHWADEAEEWLDQLERAEPATASLRTLSLRAGWLKQRGEPRQVAAAIEAFLSHREAADGRLVEESALWTRVAELYDGAGLLEQAEASYRRAAATDATGRCAYARWLATNDRLDDAVQTCLARAEADDTPQTAITLAAVLSQSRTAPSLTPEVEQFLAESLRRHPSSTSLLVSLATLRMVRGDVERARAGFEQALRLKPDDLIALNNLAMLLSDDPQRRSEAWAHLDRAMVYAGRHPELLDSKGWLCLQSGDAARAEALFREAADLNPDDPRPRFHLALSCWSQGKVEEAREALGHARRQDLSSHPLNLAERRRLAELEHELDG